MELNRDHPGNGLQEVSSQGGQVWDSFPESGWFLALLGAWVLLFQFFGCASAIAGHTGSLFAWMNEKWKDPAYDASHGTLIPFVVVGLLWMRRERLSRSLGEVWWPGLAALALALGLHVLGFLVQQPRVSMVACFFGMWVLVGLSWGTETMKASFFPFFIFAFCVPMGGTFAQGLTLPLRMMAANTTRCIAHGVLDIPLHQTGTALKDPQGVWSYEVAAECSGIRSFIALLAISTIYSVLNLKTVWRRAVVIAAAIPIALVCNVLRLTTVVVAATAFKEQAAGDFVDHYFGYLTYLVAMLLVLLLGRCLKEKPSGQPT